MDKKVIKEKDVKTIIYNNSTENKHIGYNKWSLGFNLKFWHV